jgi:hypothetical protein
MSKLPEISDIWADDEGEYFLFLTEPQFLSVEDGLLATVLNLNSGIKRLRYFDIDPKTGTLYDWWYKVG